MLLSEGGYLYPHWYLIQMHEEGQQLFFKTEMKRRDWRIALAVFGEFDDDEETDSE